ncbi:MAG: undecaprenyl-diphosphate phosphatase [Gammaproteobacteria bacterium]|nr:undecaprenyl-diphosphate phosphatase [Gammaproteobacteria bacterium]
MDLLQTVLLSLIQGLTEFLPISSSAHLILFPKLLGWDDQGLAFDVAVHVGSLSAVLVYFRRDIAPMTTDWFSHVSGGDATQNSRLAWAVILGTIPAGLAGLLLKDLVAGRLRSPLVIAATTILFGLLLWWADAKGKRKRDEHSLTIGDVLMVGCAQAMALIPGTSRSGITMTAGLFLGLTREAAARFSFLLSIPIILLAGGFNTWELLQSAERPDWSAMILGVVVSAISAYLCIHFFLKLIERVSMLPFVIYRLLLGAVLLWLYL